MVVVTDRAAVYPAVLDELLPAARHSTERYRNNRVESGDGRLKQRLRPMRGLKTDAGARTVIAGHARVQNIRPRLLRTRHRRNSHLVRRHGVHRTRPRRLTLTATGHAAHRSANATAPPCLSSPEPNWMSDDILACTAAAPDRTPRRPQ